MDPKHPQHVKHTPTDKDVTEMQQVDVATNEVAKKLEEISHLIKLNMKQQEVDDARNGLAAMRHRLEVIAADPANPVPLPVP